MALSLIAIVVVHPEMLTRVAELTRNDDRLFVASPLDVQSVNCTKMPCLLAAQGNGHQSGGDIAGSNFPMALQDLFASHRLNSGLYDHLLNFDTIKMIFVIKTHWNKHMLKKLLICSNNCFSLTLE